MIPLLCSYYEYAILAYEAGRLLMRRFVELMLGMFLSISNMTFASKEVEWNGISTTVSAGDEPSYQHHGLVANGRFTPKGTLPGF